jgi:hypothetical protein
MPPGGERKRFEGNVSALPMPFNNLQYVCRHIAALARGLELKCNHIKCNGWTFDSFRRNPINAPLLSSIRNVTLFGDFTLSENPDENILHGLIKFGFDHPHAMVKVHVWALRPRGGNGHHINGFMALGYCIREAIRGVNRPAWCSGNDRRLQAWLRGKSRGALNAPNVRFFPYRAPSCADPGWFDPRALRPLVGGEVGYNTFVNGLGGAPAFIAFVQGWYRD